MRERVERVIAFYQESGAHDTDGGIYLWVHPRRVCLVAARLLTGGLYDSAVRRGERWYNQCSRCVGCGKYINVRGGMTY
jgi:hypothetical protein